jgi:antitoxin (DNA-binding transcriptional repressor) of toxin-antitoxin stability system
VARRVSATDAARKFSDLLNRVEYRGERFVIERGGTAVCEMAPARPVKFMLSDLAGLLRSAPKSDASYWDALDRILRDQPQVEPSLWES